MPQSLDVYIFFFIIIIIIILRWAALRKRKKKQERETYKYECNYKLCALNIKHNKSSNLYIFFSQCTGLGH